MNELIHSIEAWQPILWRASWQGGLVILAAWAIARWCTFLSPRVTSWIWRLVCLKLLVTLCWTQPVAIAILPAASLSNPPAMITVENPSSPAVVEAHSPTRERLPLVEPHTSTIRENADLEGQFTIGAILVTLWIAGVCCAVALTVGRWFSARRLCRAAATTESELFQRLCRSEAERLTIRSPPRIRLSPRVESPLLAGIWRPTIVLPPRAEESFDESELRLMFGHELAHLKRYDLLWNWLPTVVGWLFFVRWFGS
jgi:bla regulator protein BlaR1